MDLVRKNYPRLIEISFLLFLFLFQLHYLPIDLFNAEPATGGDTGSHFWSLYVLNNYGLPNWTARPWNAGNLAGEGLLVHYFPLPFILMAIAGYILPLGTAFNIGTILPVITLPFAVWCCLRWWGLPAVSRIIGTAFSLAALYTESFTMWGGNTLSTLAGQFAHMYALNLLFLGMGQLHREIRERRVPLLSALFFSGCAISHAYIFIALPWLMLGFIAFLDIGDVRRRFFYVCGSGIGAVAFSLWYLGPMVLNSPWTSPHSFNWHFNNILEETFPKIFEVPAFSLALAAILFPVSRVWDRQRPAVMMSVFWIVAGVSYVGFFFVFRWLQLVDARAVPQVQLFSCIGAGIFVSLLVGELPKLARYSVTIVLTALCFYMTDASVIKYPRWMEWNYSGWSTKAKYSDLQRMSAALHGTLSDPRVVFEHSIEANRVGTERVFEMLPYFARRATNEGLYLQSTVLSRMMFYLQGEVSEKPSCPFSPKWPCKKPSLKAAEGRLRLLGAGSLILSSKVLLDDAKEQKYLTPTGQYGPWSLYALTDPAPMYLFLTTIPREVPLESWREEYWKWFLDYAAPDAQFLVTQPRGAELPKMEEWVAPGDCKAEVSVDFFGISLSTDCPGYVHVLRYAYSPWFEVTGADRPFLVSPGFIGIVPRQRQVHLTCGGGPLWRYARWISSVSFLGYLGLCIIHRRSRWLDG